MYLCIALSERLLLRSFTGQWLTWRQLFRRRGCRSGGQVRARQSRRRRYGRCAAQAARRTGDDGAGRLRPARCHARLDRFAVGGGLAARRRGPTKRSRGSVCFCRRARRWNALPEPAGLQVDHDDGAEADASPAAAAGAEVERLRLLACSIGQWVFNGLSMWCVLRSFDATLAASSLPYVTCATALTMCISYFGAFVTPSGLGVREGTLIALLSPVVGVPAATATAVVMRLNHTLVEAMLCGVGLLMMRPVVEATPGPSAAASSSWRSSWPVPVPARLRRRRRSRPARPWRSRCSSPRPSPTSAR